MLLGVMVGALFGAVEMYADIHLTMGVLGFSNPYAVFAVGVMWVMALLGLASSPQKGVLLGNLIGIPLGILGVDALRVRAFGQETLLPILGL